MDWRSIFYGGPTPKKRHAAKAVDAPPPPPPPPHVAVEPPPVISGPGAGNGPEPIYAHVPEGELRRSQQHRWLFDDGVQRWNQHRLDKEFKPVFHGVNFAREAIKTRLWGCPVDLRGDERVVLTGVNFRHADLQGCILIRADLRNACLVGADLRKVDLTCAILNGADLTDCDLRGAILTGAQFARASLRHANLTGAILKDANFAWADMTDTLVCTRQLLEANVFGATRTVLRAPESRPISLVSPTPIA